MNKPTMTADDPKWEEFRQRLEGPEGCDFRGGSWRCDSNHALARKLLRKMGYDVAKSIRYFEQHGGCCDCEILFNVGSSE